MSVTAGAAVELDPAIDDARHAAAGRARGLSRGGLSRGGLRAVPERDAVADRVSAGWRVTRRGRAVLLVLLAVLLTACVVAVGAARSGNASTDPEQRQVTVVVGEGDTLWTVAAAVVPEADRRATIERIVAANDLDGSRIEPGQQLVVPVDTP